jgi:hypothetical protein
LARVQAARSAVMFAAMARPQLTCQVFDGRFPLLMPGQHTDYPARSASLESRDNPRSGGRTGWMVASGPASFPLHSSAGLLSRHKTTQRSGVSTAIILALIALACSLVSTIVDTFGFAAFRRGGMPGRFSTPIASPSSPPILQASATAIHSMLYSHRKMTRRTWARAGANG